MSEPEAAVTVLAKLRPSAPRRVLGVTILTVLGAALIYMALAYPPMALGWTVFLLGFGGVALWLAVRLWQSTKGMLILTNVALTDETGQVIARVDQIQAVNGGTFAFKPAGGFTLMTSEPAPGVWVPGMWWRLGRSVGVGGVIHRHEARYMAEALAALTGRT